MTLASTGSARCFHPTALTPLRRLLGGGPIDASRSLLSKSAPAKQRESRADARMCRVCRTWALVWSEITGRRFPIGGKRPPCQNCGAKLANERTRSIIRFGLLACTEYSVSVPVLPTEYGVCTWYS